MEEKSMTDLEMICKNLRDDIREIGFSVKALKGHSEASGAIIDLDLTASATVKEIELRSEILANLDLSYRHIEDARMRLGKVMQAIQGGTSIFDRAPMSEPGTEEGGGES